MSKSKSIRLGEKLYSLDRGLIMGILNVTPDSFYADSRLSELNEIHLRVGRMLDEGMDLLDIGALSSRPGAKAFSEAEEWSRLKPVLKLLQNDFPDLPISVDTFRSKIALNAVEDFDVKMINDISSGSIDPEMPKVIGKLKVPIVLMHMQGNPETMQLNPDYQDVIQEILAFFSRKIDEFLSCGVEDIILDPGFGFGKTLEHNYTLLGDLHKFKALGFPILTGLSRKSMIYKYLETTPEESLNGTSILNTIARTNGADILRVHDIKEAKECLKLSNLLISRDKFTLSD